MKVKWRYHLAAVVLAVLPLLMGAGGPARAQQQRPSILIIWGDDIGQDDGSPVDFS